LLEDIGTGDQKEIEEDTETNELSIQESEIESGKRLTNILEKQLGNHKRDSDTQDGPGSEPIEL
jgi:hypothetical protein